jgi:hypothetical protein
VQVQGDLSAGKLGRTGQDASFHKPRRCPGVSAELCTHIIRPFRWYICSKGQSEVKCWTSIGFCADQRIRGPQGGLPRARRDRPAFSEHTGTGTRVRGPKTKAERPLRDIPTFRGRRNAAHRPRAPPPPVGAVSSADLDLDLDLSTQHTIKFTLHVRIVSAIGAAGLGLNFAI